MLNLSAWATERTAQVILWDRTTTPHTYRVLENGRLSEPKTGIADGTRASGIIYITASPTPQYSVPGRPGTPEHQANMERMFEAIAEYNRAHLPTPRPTGSIVGIDLLIDQRTGLIVTEAEAARVPHYAGFVYVRNADGSWRTLNVLGEAGQNPTGLVTRAVGATNQLLNHTPGGGCPGHYVELPRP